MGTVAKWGAQPLASRQLPLGSCRLLTEARPPHGLLPAPAGSALPLKHPTGPHGKGEGPGRDILEDTAAILAVLHNAAGQHAPPNSSQGPLPQEVGVCSFRAPRTLYCVFGGGGWIKAQTRS